jgi:hypothetical protein
MRKVKQILAATLMAGLMSAGVGGLAQKKKGDDSRPPKEGNKVRVGDKGSSNNQGGKGDKDKKGRH